MWKLLLIACLSLAPTVSQTAVDPAQYPDIDNYFTPKSDESRFSCFVRPLKPALGFSFRFQAGYLVQVPMKQFVGKGHKWLMLARIEPQGGESKPVYMTETVLLPDIPAQAQSMLQAGGMFLTGVGRYSVNWMMVDETGRICRAHWKTEAKLRREDKAVTVAIPPNTVQALSFRTWSGEKPGERKLRLTVLLHAAPLFPRMTRLRAYDRGLWLGALVSLLDNLHPASVRLVVFNLDQQKELYRDDTFRPRDLGRVSQAMGSLELGLVDYNVLQNRRGHLDVIADLMNQERKAESVSDAVIFLGPTARTADKLPESALEEASTAKPRFFYFEYKPYWRRGADFPDTIAHAVRRAKGRTFIIRAPGEFAKAMEQVQQLAE